MAVYEKNSFPISVKIDGKDFIHYKSLSISKDIKNFVDVFELQLNNPFGRYSTSIPVGCVVEVYYAGVLIFIGIWEEKDVSYGKVWATMSIKGREELVLLTETDADPSSWPFKNTTDNAIIDILLSGYSWTTNLGASYPVKEYAIRGGSVRVGQVIQELCDRNDLFFYKKGNTLYKQQLPVWPNKPSTKLFSLSATNGDVTFEENRVTNFRIRENISAMRNWIIGYGYENAKDKAKIKVERENSTARTWLYASRVRNQSWLLWRKLERTGYVKTTWKDEGEVRTQVKKALRATDLEAVLEITVQDFVDVNLFDNVDVFFEVEKINQTMYIREVKYVLEDNNKRYTVLWITPFNDI